MRASEQQERKRRKRGIETAWKNKWQKELLVFEKPASSEPRTGKWTYRIEGPGGGRSKKKKRELGKVWQELKQGG